MTTYDTYGRSVQSIDPGLALAGVAAAGIIGYAVANDHSDHCAPRRTRTTYHTTYNQGFCDDGFGRGNFGNGFGGNDCYDPYY